MTDANSQAIVERLRQREDELKKKEKELKLREQQIRERSEELDVSRSSVDAMLQELDLRETAIQDVEKKHGVLKKREDEAYQRDTVLSEREAQLQDKFSELSRKEKEINILSKQRQKEYDEKCYSITSREQELARRECEIRSGESDLQNKNNILHKKINDTEEGFQAKEKQLRDWESSLVNDERKLVSKTHEVDQGYGELQERQKQLKQELLDLESRDRDLKWQEESLRQTHEESTTRRQKLLKWEQELSTREGELHFIEVSTLRAEAQSDERQHDLALKTQRFITAEKDLEYREKEMREKEQRVKESLESVIQREDKLLLYEEAVKSDLAESKELSTAARKRDAELHRKQKYLDDQIHIFKEKERALKEWLVELEFRDAMLEKKESCPKPYLSDHLSTTQPQTTHQSSNNAEEKEGGPTTTAFFNSGIVAMQLQQIQGAYLGATLKSRFKKTHEQETKRRSTSLLELPADGTTRELERKTFDIEVGKQIHDAIRVFRDLIGGYSVLTLEERNRLFSFPEEGLIITAIESEVDLSDEISFLQELIATPLSQVELTCSASDSRLLSWVTKWVGDRQLLIEERQRRLAGKRLKVLMEAIHVLEGKIKPKNQRLEPLLLLPFSDGSVGVTEAYKQRAQMRLPTVVNRELTAGAQQQNSSDCDPDVETKLSYDNENQKNLAIKKQTNNGNQRRPRTRDSTMSRLQTRESNNSGGQQRGGAAASPTTSHGQKKSSSSAYKYLTPLSPSAAKDNSHHALDQQQQLLLGSYVSPKEKLIGALPVYLRKHYHANLDDEGVD